MNVSELGWTTQVVYGFIKDWSAEHGYPPTYREIAREMAIQLSAVAYHINVLLANGLLAKRSGHGWLIVRKCEPDPEAIARLNKNREALRDYKAAHPEKAREADLRYRTAHRDEINARKRQAYAARKERASA